MCSIDFLFTWINHPFEANQKVFWLFFAKSYCCIFFSSFNFQAGTHISCQVDQCLLSKRSFLYDRLESSAWQIWVILVPFVPTMSFELVNSAKWQKVYYSTFLFSFHRGNSRKMTATGGSSSSKHFSSQKWTIQLFNPTLRPSVCTTNFLVSIFLQSVNFMWKIGKMTVLQVMYCTVIFFINWLG